MANSEIPSNIDELKQILIKATPEELSKNLKELISSYKESNVIKNKKLLKLIFEYVLDCISNKLDSSEIYAYLDLMNSNIHELCHLFQTEFNEYIKNFFSELEKYILDKYSTEDFKIENRITNISLLISFLTYKLDQPNQLLSNFITLLNIHLSKFKADCSENFPKFIQKIFHIGVLEIICQNVNCFNPVLFNQIEISLMALSDFIKKNNIEKFVSLNEEKSDLKVFSILGNKISDYSQEEKLKTIKSLYLKLSQIILSVIEKNKENLNFDVLFKNIFLIVKDLQEHFSNSEIKENSLDIMNKFNEYKEKILTKKNIQLNFMIIKRKPLPSLEPDVDRSFLGRLEDYKPNNEKMAKVMKKKISSTKKQAIRNLKKEAKVIDVARQKKNRTIFDKRKEELKISNQFIEQQKIEDKKLVTSQSKKRFKLKNKRR
jgi:hypothetical protein